MALCAVTGCSTKIDGDTAQPALANVAFVPLNGPRGTGGSNRFTALDPNVTRVDFTNRLDLEHPDKRLYFSAYACGGIAVGDVDGDGLLDLYLVNGPDRNRLFRQSETLRFEDVTSSASVDGGSCWGAGAAMADIDNDGDLDIYVCNYDAANQLFLNDGSGRFREAATEFGVDLIDACLMPALCDYDRDGDLDIYVLTHRYYREGGRPQQPPVVMRNGRPFVLPEFQKYYALTKRSGNNYELDNTGRPDYVLRNNGDGTFSDVSADVGVTQPGHGLSVTWWDYNHDGWPDIYVGNDFNDPDHLYRNNGDGTFTDALTVSIPHTSWFSMGADFGDLNGDGRFDLLVADMSATTHYSQKTTMGAMSASKLALVAGPPPQVMKNALYLNSGTDRFLEAAELTGLADSDWTWSVKLADFDNDGRIDVFLTNGVSRDNTHSDYQQQDSARIGRTEWALYEARPPRPERNLAFRNTGDLSFLNVGKAWGFTDETMSYASAYADLDRDGDLDLVVANLDQPVSIHRNDVSDGQGLLVALRGTRSNSYGIGATVTIKTPSGSQIKMLSPQTGFLSSNEPLVQFGLGKQSRIDGLTVQWPSGQTQTLSQIDPHQLVTITEPEGDDSVSTPAPPKSVTQRQPTWYRRTQLGSSLEHRELEHDDFAQQPLLPNKLSQLGPGIAVADCDGDGDDDFYVGGARGDAGLLMVNQGHGQFRPRIQPALEVDRACEDMGAVWLDVDGDGDVDLYVVSGGVEAEAGDDVFRDRLYLNDGQGNLTAAPADAVPDLRDSGGPVAAADFDRDGDLDLVVGSRVVPGEYPTSPASRLLENRQGRFVDVTTDLAPELLTAGLVTGAVWSDANADGWLDLLLTTEWGPVRLFHNQQGKLDERTTPAELAERTGWWNGVAARDLDGDGDIDYVVTNFGLNTKYRATVEQPVLIYYGDFAGTGQRHLIEAEYEDDTLFPIRGKSCSTHAMPHLAEKFDTYHDFALASLPDIYTQECLAQSTKFAANSLESCVLLNDGTGVFDFRPLPRIAQVSPAFGVLLTEVNGDGRPDAYLVQNFFNAQPETGRMDGGLSQLLFGNGDGTFRAVSAASSGLIVPGDATAVAECDFSDDQLGDLLVGVNNDEMLAFTKRESRADENDIGKIYRIELRGRAGNPSAIGARITLHSVSGRQTAEVHAGSGYLSQSTHVLSFGVPEGSEIERIEVRWPDGSETIHPAEVTTRRQIITRN